MSFLEYQYAIGLTLGLVMGAWMKWTVLPFIVLIWCLVIIERMFFSDKYKITQKNKSTSYKRGSKA